MGTSAMGGVLVLPCYICGNLLQLWCTTQAERDYFHSVDGGIKCANKLRQDYEKDRGCS